MRHSHSLCLLDYQDFSALLGNVNNYLNDGYAVIYAAETNLARIRKKMMELGIDVENHLKNGSLTIIDRELAYSIEKTNLEAQALIDIWFSLIYKVLNERKFKGVIVIGSSQVFIDNCSQNKLTEYEQKLGKSFDIDLESICCYDIKTVNCLSLEDLISIISSHAFSIHKGYMYVEWNQDKVMDLVFLGLDNTLGKNVSSLVLKAMNLVYNVNREMIIANPALLGNTLRKMLGTSADIVLSNIMCNIIKELVFDS